ncbi:hypothetical protein PILCRDRAFT_57775, partial [Piloderma croceum F 1598]
FDSNPNLLCNFAKGPWPAAVFNFSPYRPWQPLSDGWCTISSLGFFDPQRGGQLILWDLGLIDLPPRLTILIPSMAIQHSNTTIQLGEMCYSFTYYTAGRLFH